MRCLRVLVACWAMRFPALPWPAFSADPIKIVKWTVQDPGPGKMKAVGST